MTFLHSCFLMPDQGTAVYHFCSTSIYDVDFAKVANIAVLAVQVFATLIFACLWHHNYKLMVSK
ncbi:unnamed protein product [Toxocara canis]|uniref:G protein-coupled receptor n=1 Tax=Toxocara canis TaxID=6265 RepID=A0A183U2X3_TOXCA|nr:unnamed protein product [Toxocara canis]